MNHIGTVPLETERLFLRRIRKGDAKGIYRYASDPRVTRYLTWPTHENMGVSEAIEAMWLNEYEKPDFYLWAIVPKGEDELIGVISCVDIVNEDESVEIGYSMAYDYWGHGYMPEALNALLRFFFEQVGVKRVTARHDTRNEKSGRVMRKCLMRFEGVERGVNRYKETGDIAHYSLLKKDYGKDIWDILLDSARAVQNGRTLTPFMEAGGVAAAVLSKSGRIYTGVCVDTCSSLGMCAERNAMANMITHGESRIDKVAAVMPDGRVGAPCGACREFMMQLDRGNGDAEILTDAAAKRTVRLRDLMPDWWGTDKYADTHD